MLDPLFPLVTASFLVWLWLPAAWQKQGEFVEFGVILAEFRLVPAQAVRACAVAVIGLELGLGVSLMFPATRSFGLAGSALLLVLYAAAIGVNLHRGRRSIDCGCVGPLRHQSLSGWLVARNLLLALLALAALSPVNGRALVWHDLITGSTAFGLAILLYVAANRLIAKQA